MPKSPAANNKEKVNGNSYDTFRRHNERSRSGFCGSDIDLFLCGLSEAEALDRIRQIAARLSSTCSGVVRTVHAITFERCWPNRHVQVVLKLFDSPQQCLSSFDIDCCAVGFDGAEVFCLPRARAAINRAVNFVDPLRVSPTYDFRLWKYSQRGFGVCIPGFSGVMELSALAKPRKEASILARIMKLHHDESLQSHSHPFHGFYGSRSTKFNVSRDDNDRRAVVPPGGGDCVEPVVKKLENAGGGDLTVGDAYGDGVTLPYWPWRVNARAPHPRPYYAAAQDKAAPAPR